MPVSIVGLRFARWRRGVAWCALLALAAPSLGVAPWIALEAASRLQAETAHAHHHHGDGSEIPGSPTHPLDHDCLQCQLLAQLARYVVHAPPAPIVRVAAELALRRCRAATPARAPSLVTLPPVRGPPLVAS